MFLAFLLSRLKRNPRFVWTPSLDLRDRKVYSDLISNTQY